MGIKGLNAWLKKTVPNVFKTTDISTFSGERLAIDTSVYLYKFICISNGMRSRNGWLDIFISFTMYFRKYNIHPIFVFDGKHPVEKDLTKADRAASKLKLQHKIKYLQQLLENIEEVSISQIQEFLPDITVYTPDVYVELNKMYLKLQSQCINITSTDIENLKTFFSLAGFCYLQATTEAEKVCSWLCIAGYVKGVVTVDSDVLAYGTLCFLQDVKMGSKTCITIQYDELLESLDLTREQFIDLCIMCGTDYNTNIPGIGPAKAYQLIKQHGSLDELSGTKYDVSVLRYQTARRIFTTFEQPLTEDFELIPVKGNPKELLLWLTQHNSRYTPDEVLVKPKSTFIVI